MISAVVQKPLSVVSAPVGNSHPKVQSAIERTLMLLAIGCFTTVGMMTIAAPTVAQTMPMQAAQAIPVVAASPRLSRSQMEQTANILLGLIYFVLPVGLCVGLVLHDRHQAQHHAALEAQIKLLEKIWHQSSQA